LFPTVHRRHGGGRNFKTDESRLETTTKDLGLTTKDLSDYRKERTKTPRFSRGETISFSQKEYFMYGDDTYGDDTYGDQTPPTKTNTPTPKESETPPIATGTPLASEAQS
jgi:hypothetical protein